jgi:cation:H+ antiporter
MSDSLLAVSFTLAALVSLGASWRLVVSLERVGARLGLSEALLGLLAALAADAPEITSAVTALARHDQHVGAGVIIGSNVFNLAALLGLSSLVAGRIALHRRVLELSGALALWISAVALMLVGGLLSPLVALLVVLAVLVPYVAVLALPHERLARLALPVSWSAWLIAAVSEEEVELEAAIHPRRGSARDALVASFAVAIVVAASIEMEHSGAELGVRWGISSIVVGALLLAVVTSLPNAVAAIYLALRGRGAAVLSTSLNSNAFNILAGLLIPTSLLGVGAPSGQTTYVAASALAMTLLALACAYLQRGLRRSAGAVIVCAYLAFVCGLTLLSW